MITYAVESWTDAKAEMSALWIPHWNEVALNREKIPLNPDLDAYDAMEARGELHVVVARKEGAVVGYHFSIIRTHLHYKQSLNAFVDIFYVSPEQRTGRTPMRLFQFVEKTLKARGVEKIFTGTKCSLDAGPLFEFMGWTKTEVLYTKFIGD